MARTTLAGFALGDEVEIVAGPERGKRGRIVRLYAANTMYHQRADVDDGESAVTLSVPLAGLRKARPRVEVAASEAHIAAGRTDHIAAEPSEAFPIKMVSKADGTVEYCTMAYAVQRLSGYYRLDGEDAEDADIADWIERRLREGTPLQTISFFYRLA